MDAADPSDGLPSGTVHVATGETLTTEMPATARLSSDDASADPWCAPAGAVSRVATARPSGQATPRALPPESANLITRRSMLRTSFWAGLSVGLAGLALGFVNFFWPRKVGAFGGVVTVPAVLVPGPGSEPVKIFEAKTWLVNLAPGEGVPEQFTSFAQPSANGGILALYQKCPHLGCSVPWQRDFPYQGIKGWFRCPCHQSTYTKAGVRVFGPAPRPMDTFAVRVLPDGSIEIDTSRITKGDTDNPQRAMLL